MLEGERGFFTIDRRKALEKMRESQLPDPHHYVLNLVSAGAALQASGIELEIDHRHVQVILKGVTLSQDFMQQPLQGLFISGEHTDLDGYRELAIGLNAALGLEPASCDIVSGGCRTSLKGIEVRTTEAPSRVDTVIEVAGRSRFWSRGKTAPELKVLEDRAGYTSVTVNQQPLSPRVRPGPVAYQHDGVSMWLARSSPGLVRFVKHGIHICDRTLQLKTPGANAIVVADGLLKNVSGTDVVENDAYAAVLAKLDAACDGWLNVLCNAYATADLADRPDLRVQLLHAIASQPPSRLSQRLLYVPVFETLDGQPLCAHDLQVHVERNKQLLIYYEEQLPAVPSNLTIVRIREHWAEAALQNLFGRAALKSADDEVSRVLHQAVLERRFRSESRSITLPPGAWLITVPFDERGCRGELGIPRQGGGEVHIEFFRKGRKVAERLWTDRSVSYRLCIQNDSLTPCVDREDIEEDDVYRMTLVRGGLVLGEAFRRLASSVRPPHPDAVWVRTFLCSWLSGRYSAQKLEKLSPAIRTYPLFPTVSSELVSLADLQSDAYEFGSVFYVAEGGPGYQRDHRRIVLGAQAAIPLQSLFVRVTDYTQALAQERRSVVGVPTPAALAGQALCAVSFVSHGVTGVVGVATHSTHPETTIRVLRAGQPWGTRTVTLECGPLEAIIDIPDGRFEDVAEHVKQASNALALHVSKAYDGSPRLRDFLLGYMGWKVPDIPEPLTDLPLFRSLGGKELTLRTLRGYPTLRWTEHDVGDVEVDQPVLVASPAEAESVARLAGIQRAERWDDSVAQSLARERFLRGVPEVGAFSAQCIFRHTVDGLRIGFLPPTSTYSGRSSLRIFWQHRLIETVSVPAPVPVDVVATGDALKPRPGFDGVQRDEAFDALLEKLKAGIEAGIEALATSDKSPDTVLMWALSHASGASLVQAPEGSLLAMVVEVPLLFDSTSLPMSLKELATQARARRCCYWVTPHTAGRPLDQSLRLVRLSPMQVRWVERVFPELQDYSLRLRQEVDERDSHSRPRVTSLKLKAPALATCRVGAAGELGISADGSKGVQLVQDACVVETRPLFGDLPVIGVLLAGTPEAAMDDAVDQLYASVATTHARLLLPWFHHRLERLLATRPSDLRGAAAEPVFQTVKGPLVSLAALMQTARDGGTVWYSGGLRQPCPDLCLDVDGPTLALLSEVLGSKLQRASLLSLPVPAAVQTVAARTVKAPWWSWLASYSERLWRMLQSPLHPALSDADQEASLAVLSLLQDCLRTFPPRNEHGLSDAVIESIALSDSGALVGQDRLSHGLYVNRRHALMRHLMKLEPRQRQPVVMLAATLYSTWRDASPDLTDTHETSFLHYLGEWRATL